MPKSYELLLVENVESLGIVGDVVNVRSGFARNFLLPRGLATTPSEEKIKALAARRAAAEKQVAEQRASRESMVDKLEGYEMAIERSCNDQGLLYGSVTQQELATMLQGAGYAVRARDVRIMQTIKRIGDYEIIIKPESDLEATVKLHVKPDRPLEMIRRAEEDAAAAAAAMAAKNKAAGVESPAEEAAEEAPAAEEVKKPKKDKPAKDAEAKSEDKPKKAKKA
jgi:large subunit ribosomal protein L9